MSATDAPFRSLIFADKSKQKHMQCLIMMESGAVRGRQRGRWHWSEARKPLLVTQPWELLSALLNPPINAYLSEAPRGQLHVRFYFTDCLVDKRNLISEPTQKARCALWVYWSGSTAAAVSANVCAAGIIRNMLHAGCSKLQELNKPDRGPVNSFQG